MQYLGHTASRSRVFVGLRKIAAVSVSQTSRFEFPRSFLGLALYYRQFVSERSRIAGPLYVLTRKDAPFVWTDVIKKAFETVKELLTEASTLVFSDFSKWKEFHSLTDASGEGLGAVLAQKQEHGLEKLIAFASQAVQQHECNYGVTEMEGLRSCLGNEVVSLPVWLQMQCSLTMRSYVCYRILLNGKMGTIPAGTRVADSVLSR